jgi:superfamily II DNA/RNA helicase
MSMQAQLEKQHVIQVPHVPNVNAMLGDVVRNEGDFDNYPEITEKTRIGLRARGISHLFPVQIGSFRHVWARKDLIVRDLTGSGKTLGFALPTVEYLRKSKTLGSGKI